MFSAEYIPNLAAPGRAPLAVSDDAGLEANTANDQARLFPGPSIQPFQPLIFSPQPSLGILAGGGGFVVRH